MLNQIKLIAVDTDGVLFNDTYSPAIERFVKKHGGDYTAEVERGVWGSPQLAAGQNMALACRLPWSAKETIAAFFAEREQYLSDHPVEVAPTAEKFLALAASTGAKVISYGGRDRAYSFDRFLSPLAKYFDPDLPYIDVNDFRPGMKEIVRDIYKVNFNQTLFIDDINRVAEVSKALEAGFIGIPSKASHNFQRQQMEDTGAPYLVNEIGDIDSSLLQTVDEELRKNSHWN
jgi:phosphoglycolate phosphatase-like HAD superfamily hydrolase